MQLPLNIRLTDAYCFANFFGENNNELLAALKSNVTGLADPDIASPLESIFIFGLQGSGKSHLLQSACQLARELDIGAVYLPLGQPGLEHPQVLDGLTSLSLVCVDDVQRVAGNEVWEAALFSLYENLQGNGLLVCASDSAPGDSGLQLPDLVSRLRRGLVYGVKGLAHDQKLDVVRRRAKLRGIEISNEVANYIERNFPRDMATLVALLEQLDQESLIQQRRITVPFIRSLIAQSTPS